ncbi:MAG: acetate/propionate family kinase [Polyangiales bacterium]
MKVLVLNAGSTSVKYNLYEMDTEARIATGRVERIGGDAAHVGADRVATPVHAPTHREAIAAVLASLAARGALAHAAEPLAVGHRVVHGGEELIRPVRIDDAVKRTITECAVFAPIHNPVNLAGIEAAQAVLPEAEHVAVFDTAFHAQMPAAAFTYAVPQSLYLQRGIRRYGFHGPSHQYMALSAAEHLRTDLSRLRLVTCHLGGGCSLAAIDGGVSVETTMGLTPLEGLVMGTRSGDLDPAIPVLLGRGGMSPDEVDALLNRQSGLAGLSGVASGDYRDIERAADEGDVSARLAIEVFTHRVRKYLGAYAAILGGVDAVVFTGGIGENSARLRAAVCEGMTFMGVSLDPARNADPSAFAVSGVTDVSTRRAPARVLVLPTDEERMIAREVMRCLRGPTAAIRSVQARPIPVGVSVRHVHLSAKDCAALFGEGYELSHRRDVTQKGQYVTRETVDLVGPKGEIRGVAIINPLRSETQVELARTDAFVLGVKPPLRESGQLDDTPGITLRGTKGEVRLPRGVILAQRHVHMSPDDARTYGVKDKDVIRVQADGDREMEMGDVLVRVREDFVLDMHIDTDEANAAGLHNDSVVSYAGVQSD